MTPLTSRIPLWYNKILRGVTGRRQVYGWSGERANISAEEASGYLHSAIKESRPVLVSRLGGVELHCVLGYLYPWSFSNALRYVRGDIGWMGWRKASYLHMPQNAGFFPATPEHFTRFAKLMLADYPGVDLLGTCWREEAFLDGIALPTRRVPIQHLEPFWASRPWTAALVGRKVLVVHPFAEAIRRQYARRELLFARKDQLPAFELQVLPSVQSIAGNHVSFPTWFDALDYMSRAVSSLDFDVAIVGCGAYGLPLAAHIKRMGKVAIHLGGATQLLFGIRGKRWDDNPEYRAMMNEHWIRPLPEDRPANFKRVEEGCYW